MALQGGPGTIGVLGLLLAALTLCSTVFGIGLSSSGVRYVAAAKEQELEDQAAVRSALVQGVLVLGCAGGLVVAALSPWLGRLLFQDPAQRHFIWYLAPAIAASVITGGQQALLNGQGRLKELALSNVVGGVLGTLLTLVALSFSKPAAILAAFVAPVGMTLLASTWFVVRIPKIEPSPRALQWKKLRLMVYLGAAFSGSVLLTSAAQLGVRVFLQRQVNIQAVGYFQASWTIAGVYLGFVLNAMAAEYYPRISAISRLPQQLNAHVERQIWIALLLAGPAILWMIVLAPFGMRLLYSSDFLQAADLLRLQLIGDVLKVPAWALGFVLLAREARLKFFFAETVAGVLLFGFTAWLFNSFGLQSVGYAYILSYLIYFLVILVLVSIETGYIISTRNTILLVTFLLSAIGFTTLNSGHIDIRISILIAFIATLISILILLSRGSDVISNRSGLGDL